MKAILKRRPETNTETIGDFTVLSFTNELLFKAVTLELLDKKNEKRISCIPKGKYNCRKIISPKFGNVFEIQRVSHRSNILIHAGNTNNDTQGCILIGASVSAIPNTNSQMITSSRSTLSEFMLIMPKTFTLTIK